MSVSWFYESSQYNCLVSASHDDKMPEIWHVSEKSTPAAQYRCLSAGEECLGWTGQ